jgi:branched-chain amino acid transport system substrate-binding protein
MEKDRVVAAKGSLENTVFAMYEKPQQDFIQRFRKRFKKDPGISSDTAYDAVRAYARAVEDAKSFDSAAVQQRLSTMKNFRGASGTFSFDNVGAVDKRPVLWRVVGTEYQRVT